MKVSLTFRGQRTLERNLKQYGEAFVGKRMAKLQLHAAQNLRDDIRAETPMSDSGTWSKKYPSKPGELRRSVQAGVYKKRPGKLQAAFVAVQTKNPKMVFPNKPLWVIYGTHGRPGNDFFRRGVAIGKPGVRSTMRAGIAEISRDAIAGFTHTID